MPSTTDPLVRKVYVAHIFDLYKHFDDLPSNDPEQSMDTRRVNKFKHAISEVVRAARVPPVRNYTWTSNGALFNHQAWSMELDSNIRNLHPRRKDWDPAPLPEIVNRRWLSAATAAFHEAVHVQQFFWMAQAMLLGAVAIPDAWRRDAKYPHDTLEDRVSDLWKGCAYPQKYVDDYARRSRDTFPQDKIPLVRSWVESVFGKKHKERHHVLSHQDRFGHCHRAYRSLPEESHAFLAEDLIEKDLLDVIVRDAKDQGFGPPVHPPSLVIHSNRELVNQARAELGFRGMRHLFRKGPR